MKTRDCSLCGRAAPTHVWGFALLAKDGWAISSSTEPPGAAERAWLCRECALRAEIAEQALAKRVPPKVAREPAGARPLRVLLVDDHVLLLRCMARLLVGCETVMTTSPRKALGMLLEGGKFDVIVCDVMMPEVTGPELYARCLAHSPALGRHFLFTSSDPIFARRAIDAVAVDAGVAQAPLLLRKPLSQAALMAAVTAVARDTAHTSGTYELHLPDFDSATQARTDRPVRRSSTGFR